MLPRPGSVLRSYPHPASRVVPRHAYVHMTPPSSSTHDLSAYTAGTPDDLNPLIEGRDVRFGHSVSAVVTSSAIERVLDPIIGA